ncbi:MAG: structural protein P5 [Mediterranea massiliensis]|nr:structural protein P5 [Mediterranea massiliensis]
MRGLRNNNPLNIRNGVSRWKGMEERAEEKEFVCFLTLSMGYRAAWILLRNYRQRLLNEGKSYTLGNIIERWAPPEDGNDSKAYVRSVLRLCAGKVAGRQPLPMPDTIEGKPLFTEIIAAMTCVENGIGMDAVDRGSIEKGWELAFG